MNKVQTLYWRIFYDEGKQLKVSVGSSKNFSRLRVALCKYHRKAKNALAVDDDESVCANFDPETATATFWIGQKRSKSALEFTIIEEEPENAQMPGSLEEDSEFPESSGSEAEGQASTEEFYTFGKT